MIFKIYNDKFFIIRIIVLLMLLFLYHSNLFAGNHHGKVNFYDSRIKQNLKKIPRIDAVKALWLFKSGKLTVIDTHEHVKEGDKSPIVGAITLSYRKIPKVKLKVPKNRILACF